ncbi:lysophospholipid acyltransferase family protein [Longimicrobium sp.]|uniref:lysophospholipid acyltransferase family protein n=1 Tax=Longimicrobium sp. TaxID=2029185 RepID=UPI002E348658|nr:lysophospholipid acyltransferase family protein [Longimicrobium sp.]HEX6039156.1 lysophospholipid acyltransferase family protein [Longimicrobium sp.]
MILGVLRALWMIFWIFWGTLAIGGAAIVMALFGIRGPVYVRMTRRWAQVALWSSGSNAVLHGLENVTPGQPFILVANHVSWFDIFAIAARLPVDYHFVAKKELEKIPVFGLAWRVAGHISIDRTNRESAARSLRKAGEQMRQQKSVVVIFAEGTRSRTGRLLPFKKGAFVLAAETGIPIIPTIVTGSFDIMRPDTFVVRPATIHVYFEPAVPAQGVSVDALMTRTRDVFVQRLGETDSLPPLDPAPALPDPTATARGEGSA